MTDLLTGIRVLDLSTTIAGPSATMILADMGADVIQVEHPEKGNPMRAMGPHKGEWGAYSVAINRGKRSLALDVAQPEGRDLILRLVKGCDVLVENFVDWKTTELGLDENAVRAVRPDVLYVSLSAYGSRGPDHEKSGSEALLQARTGILSVTGGSDVDGSGYHGRIIRASALGPGTKDREFVVPNRRDLDDLPLALSPVYGSGSGATRNLSPRICALW